MHDTAKVENRLVEIRRLSRMLLDNEGLFPNTIEKIACEIHDEAGKLLGSSEQHRAPSDRTPLPVQVEQAMELIDATSKGVRLIKLDFWAAIETLLAHLRSQPAPPAPALTRQQFDSAMEGYDVGNTTKQTVLERLNAALRSAADGKEKKNG
jgi:hypothetical protein